VRQFAPDHDQGVNFDQDFILSINRMKVWRIMVIEIHPDNDTEETTEFRHPHLAESFVAAAEYPFPLEKSRRLFGEF
jgi:hypothetical protein